MAERQRYIVRIDASKMCRKKNSCKTGNNLMQIKLRCVIIARKHVMKKQFHFISGLPRSGSTLLAALLLQNSRFHAGMTSPVGALFSGMVSQFSVGSEFGAVITREQRQRLSRGIFKSYVPRT